LSSQFPAISVSPIPHRRGWLNFVFKVDIKYSVDMAEFIDKKFAIFCSNGGYLLDFRPIFKIIQTAV
jgi:hypothetical protein